MRLSFLLFPLFCLSLLGLLNCSQDSGSLPAPQYNLVSKEFTSMEIRMINGSTWDMISERLYDAICFAHIVMIIEKIFLCLQVRFCGFTPFIGLLSYEISYFIYSLHWGSFKGLLISLFIIGPIMAVMMFLSHFLPKLDMTLSVVGGILSVDIIYYYSKPDAQKANLTQTIKEDALTFFSYSFWVYVMSLLKSVVLDFQGVIIANVIVYTCLLTKFKKFLKVFKDIHDAISTSSVMGVLVANQGAALMEQGAKVFSEFDKAGLMFGALVVFIIAYNMAMLLRSLNDENGYSLNAIILTLRWFVVGVISSAISSALSAITAKVF